MDALGKACRGLPVTPTAVLDALAPDGAEAWRNGEITPEATVGFARALVQRRDMGRGRRPAHYTEQATCKHCGPVWLWFSGEVLGCPWCRNRLTGLPIPRPEPVTCGSCRHFQRIDHPHLGHCAAGEPEAVSGLWDTDRRSCGRWLP